MTKLTTRQAAAVAGISRITLVRWMRDGKLPAPKPVLIGARGMRLWSEADVRRILATKRMVYRKGRGRKKKLQRGGGSTKGENC